MTIYARNTKVPVDRSKAAIERVLKLYGAGQFGYMAGDDNAAIVFEMNGRRILFRLKLPVACEMAQGKYEASVRQKWRALLLCIKGKLEAVESEIETFEVAFMPHIVLPNGNTVADAMVPQIEQAYESKKMPPLLGYVEK